MNIPPWVTSDMLMAARSGMGRYALMTRFGLTEYKARVLLSYSEKPIKIETQDSVDPIIERAAAILQTRGCTITDLANSLDVSPARAKDIVNEMRERGYYIDIAGDSVSLNKDPVPAEVETALPAPDGALIKFGFVSDTHLGSRCQQLTFLRDTYRRFEAAGIDTVFHVGDLLAGVSVYRGQVNDLFVHTYEEQVSYAAEVYPKIPGIITKVIGGNHDLAALKVGGLDPIAALSQRREDIEYLGPYSAWATHGAISMYLLHPQGAMSYAKSYKLQKLAESFEGGEKPNLALVGHWHQRVYVETRNIHLFLAGCYESQTEFERRLMLQPTIGGGIIEIQVNDHLDFHDVRPSFFKYYVPKERDW